MKVMVFVVSFVLLLGHLGLNAADVSFPKANSKLCLGKRYNISWNPAKVNAKYATILLYDGSRVELIIKRKTTNDGNFSWTVPSKIKSRSNYRIKIEGVRSNGKAWSGKFRIHRCRSRVKKPPVTHVCRQNKNKPYKIVILKFELNPVGNDRFNYVLKIKNEGKKCLEAYHWEIRDHTQKLITIGQGSLGSHGYMLLGGQTKTHTGAILKSKCTNLGNCPDRRMECCNIRVKVFSPEPGGIQGYNIGKWITLDWGKMTYKNL